MYQIVTKPLSVLPIINPEKISDLIYYDGPILSHYRDESGTDYLYYWAEVTEVFNRWLILKVTESQLYEFLSGILTLPELFKAVPGGKIYSIDIDSDFKYVNPQLYTTETVPYEYLPDEDAKYPFPFPNEYGWLKSQFEDNFLLSSMKRDAFYFKFENIKNGNDIAPGLEDMAEFMKKISYSFTEYVEYDFFNIFKSQYTDNARLQKLIRQVKENCKLKVVDLHYNSFEIAVSARSYKTDDIDLKIIHWLKSISDKFKVNVIDLDYSSENVISGIIENYDEAQRSKIFLPILDILTNKKYTVTASNYKRSFTREFKSVSIKIKKTLLPQKSGEIRKEQMELRNVVVEVPIGQDVTSLNAVAFRKAVITSDRIDSVVISFDNITHNKESFVIDPPLKTHFWIEGLYHHLDCDEIGIYLIGNSREDVIEKFVYTFFEQYYKAINDIDNCPSSWKYFLANYSFEKE